MNFPPQIQSNVQGLKLEEFLRRNVKNKEEEQGVWRVEGREEEREKREDGKKNLT